MEKKTEEAEEKEREREGEEEYTRKNNNKYARTAGATTNTTDKLSKKEESIKSK